MKYQIFRYLSVIAAITALCGFKAAGSEREYLPILEDGKSWVLVEKRVQWKPEDKEFAYYDVSIVGDITFGNKPCKKVSIVERGGKGSSSVILYEENGKLYYAVNYGSDIDVFWPLIDLTLEKGDKVNYYIGATYPPEVAPDDYLTIRDSGSVTTEDGVERKVLYSYSGWTHIPGTDGSEAWVEGIGCSGDTWLTAFPKPTNGRWIYSYIDCCMKDGEVLFTKADFDKLLSKHTGIDETGHNEILSIAYSDDTVSAVCDGKDVSLELYSSEGRLIGRTRKSVNATLETSALPGGIYIARAICGENSVVRKIAL